MSTRPRHSVALLGLPTDEGSTFSRGAAGGPAAIRDRLYSEAANLTTEAGLDLADEPRLIDLGDLRISAGEAGRLEIERAVADQLARDRRVLSLGGDHSVTYPIVSAFERHHGRLTVVQIDAHPDLYDRFDGRRHSHASPFARVMEAGSAGRLVQIGIRAATAEQSRQAARFGVEIVPRRQWLDLDALALEPPVYLSLDLDGIDPAFAPGVAHPEACGLTSSETLELIWRLPGLVGADVVELDPTRDPAGVTAALASKLVKELAARLLEPAP